MKTLSLTLSLVLLSLLSYGQNGYAAFSTIYTPIHGNSGYFGGQLSVGRVIGNAFLEYNQNMPFSFNIGAPFAFQLRGGIIYPLDRNLSLKPFVGYSVTSCPSNENRKAGHGVTFGCSLIQDTGGDFDIKYEVAFSNHFIVPCIGVVTKF